MHGPGKVNCRTEFCHFKINPTIVFTLSPGRQSLLFRTWLACPAPGIRPSQLCVALIITTQTRIEMKNDISTALETKLVEFMKTLLKLEDDVVLTPETNLIEEVGLDSIEAFEAVATLHDIMDVTIPEDFNAKSVSSLRQLAMFVESHYSSEAINRFLDADMVELASGWSLNE